MMRLRPARDFFLLLVVLCCSAVLTFSQTQLVSGTAVLLSQSSTSNGGNGGNTSSTTSSTNIFSPSVFVDYKRFGGEPTVAVDHYPGGNDVAYVSGPNGFVFPHYSPFFKSADLGQTYRIPAHVPSFGQTFGTGGGGGDSYQVIGQVSHKVFFVDLPGPACITMNTSADQGETWVGDNIGCGQSPGAIDDRNGTLWMRPHRCRRATLETFMSHSSTSPILWHRRSHSRVVLTTALLERSLPIPSATPLMLRFQTTLFAQMLLTLLCRSPARRWSTITTRTTFTFRSSALHRSSPVSPRGRRIRFGWPNLLTADRRGRGIKSPFSVITIPSISFPK